MRTSILIVVIILISVNVFPQAIIIHKIAKGVCFCKMKAKNFARIRFALKHRFSVSKLFNSRQ
jgi:hypothetical protein